MAVREPLDEIQDPSLVSCRRHRLMMAHNGDPSPSGTKLLAELGNETAGRIPIITTEPQASEGLAPNGCHSDMHVELRLKK